MKLNNVILLEIVGLSDKVPQVYAQVVNKPLIQFAQSPSPLTKDLLSINQYPIEADDVNRGIKCANLPIPTQLAY